MTDFTFQTNLFQIFFICVFYDTKQICGPILPWSIIENQVFLLPLLFTISISLVPHLTKQVEMQTWVEVSCKNKTNKIKN